MHEIYIIFSFLQLVYRLLATSNPNFYSVSCCVISVVDSKHACLASIGLATALQGELQCKVAAYPNNKVNRLSIILAIVLIRNDFASPNVR